MNQSSLRFLVDEDLPRSTTAALRQLGHDVDDVRDVGLRGRADQVVFAYAQERRAILVTADKGFGNTISYPPGTHCGILLLRIPDDVPNSVANEALIQALDALRSEPLAGALAIVEVGRVRLRRG